jgi:cell wall assembly regulator SMI1
VASVAEAWSAIECWLARWAPVSAGVLGPPADPTAITAAEAALGLAFPSELVESLLRHDGQTVWANIFPEAALLSVAGIVEHWTTRMDVAADVGGFTVSKHSGEPWWHASWLPFAESEGDVQVFDLRPGPDFGRLGFPFTTPTATSRPRGRAWRHT